MQLLFQHSLESADHPEDWSIATITGLASRDSSYRLSTASVERAPTEVGLKTGTAIYLAMCYGTAQFAFLLTH